MDKNKGMTKEEKAYLFCHRHMNNYKIKFKALDRFPAWWHNIPYWDDCYNHLIEKNYIKVTKQHLEDAKELVKKELLSDLKEDSKGTRANVIKESYFKSKEKYINFLVMKKICIKYFTKQI